MPTGSLKSFCEEHYFCPSRGTLQVRLGAIVPGVHRALVSIEPLFCSPQKREWKQLELDRILRYSLENKNVAMLQELLEMSVSIHVGLATERAGLHHRNETHLDLEILPSSIDLRSGGNLGRRGSRVITKRLLGHGVRCGWRNNDWFSYQE